MSRDTSFYYSFLVLPPRKRRAIVAVWDFCRAVDDAVDVVVPVRVGRVPTPSTSSGRPEPAEGGSGPARDPLAMWRAELEACYRGGPCTAQGKALQPHIREFNLPRAPFEELIDGVAMDLAPARY